MEAYNILAAAIIRRAINDYILALKKNDEAKKTALEKFFLGGYGQLLSDYSGEYIINLCKEKVKNKKKARRKK